MSWDRNWLLPDLIAWVLREATTFGDEWLEGLAFNEGSNCPPPPPKKKGLCLYGRLFLCMNIVIDPEALELTMWLSFQLFNRHYENWEVAPDPASDSDKPDKPLFKPGTEILIKTLESGGQSLEPFWEGPYQISLTSYMGLLLQTPKVLSLLFDRKTMPSCPDFIPMLNSIINLIAGSAECSPSSSIEGFSWWVSLLQEKDFLQLCKSDDI